MTFSIVARSPDGESWGVAVASKFLAVGSAVPAAVAGIGALATQADAHVGFKGEGLALLDEGATAEVALERLLGDDPGRDHRQVGIVDLDTAATYTGSECLDWAGGIAGTDVAVQGNVLTGPEVVHAMKQAWDDGAPEDPADPGAPLADRLLAALRAGDAAGGDRRGRQSAALLVVRDGAGYAGRDDLAVDLRVDDHTDPVAELTRLLDLNDFYLTASTEAEQVPVTPELAEELTRRAQALGHRDLAAWVGSGNYEMRVDDGPQPAWIDARVLAIIREE